MPNDINKLNIELENIVQKCVPNAQRRAKYGGTLFTLKPAEKEGQFCGVFAYTSHVQLSFSNGVLLDDPDRMLAGAGKSRRHVNLKCIDDVDQNSLARLIDQSAKLSMNS